MRRETIFSFVLLIIAGLTSGCGGDDNPAEPVAQTRTIAAISGSLENWNLGTGKTISLVYGGIGSAASFGSSEINEDGSFSISLSEPDSTLLKSVKGFINGACEKEITVSDPAGMYISGMLLVMEGSSVIGFVQHGGAYGQTQVDTAGSFNIDYYYFDRNVDISGVELCGGAKERYDYNLSFEKGWNRSAGVLVENASSSVKYEYKVDIPEGGMFIFRRL